MDKAKIDYSLYLVTDSRLLSQVAKSFEDHVEKLVDGGVTVVQLREKSLSTAELIKRGKQLLSITKRKGIPLIVNDRLDVALAIDADGVHLGQDDMDAQTARRLVGKDKIIGVSCNTIAEAKKAVEDGADYLGIGAIFDTSTKKLTVPLCGIKGLREILKFTGSLSPPIRTVAIGGLNASNIARVIYQSANPCGKAKLDGVAVVSALMSADNPQEAATTLKGLIHGTPSFVIQQSWKPKADLSANNLSSEISRILQEVQKETPLVHHLTNNVVKNFSANITLAVGASPIMSEAPLDFPALANLPSPHSVVLNLGTLTPDLFTAYHTALYEYNKAGWPVILDPVAAGATEFRARAVAECLEKGYVDVIKGNLGEIMAVAGWEGGKSRGVDSIDTGSLEDRCRLAEFLSQRERNIVVVTGKEDVISDGEHTMIVKNGNALLGKITGSGCSLGSVLGACLAVERSQKLPAALTAVLLYSIASEYAAANSNVNGPGTFLSAFVDEINHLSAGDYDWIQKGNIQLWNGS